jgi:electron transfer flavoprotein alpha subunit
MTVKGGNDNREEGIKTIWVLPELNGRDGSANKPGPGLLTAAARFAEKVGGAVTAISFDSAYNDFSEILGKYGVTRHYFFKDPLFEYLPTEAYTMALLPKIREESPRLFLMGDTVIGRDLAPRLAALLNTGLVTGGVKIDLSDPEQPKFYRPVYAGQLYQEIIPQNDKTLLVTMDPAVLDIRESTASAAVETQIIEPGLPPEAVKVRHIAYLPADFQEVDVADAQTIVAAGLGAATDDLFPLVEELAALLEGAIGATRPVIDAGKVPRDRLIGQTGKVVGPDFYLALGISGATHHVGGIQESGKIVAVNKDPRAAIFRSSDFGISADLRDVLPALIKRIKQAKENGEIV